MPIHVSFIWCHHGDESHGEKPVCPGWQRRKWKRLLDICHPCWQTQSPACFDRFVYESIIPVLQTHVHITACLALMHCWQWHKSSRLRMLVETCKRTVCAERLKMTFLQMRYWFSYVSSVIITSVIKDSAVFCWHTPGLSRFICTLYDFKVLSV